MDMEYTKLKNVIADILNLDPEEITEESSFTDLGADSLDLLQIVMGLEEEFGVKVAEDKVMGIKTVGEALDLIKNELGIAE